MSSILTTGPRVVSFGKPFARSNGTAYVNLVFKTNRLSSHKVKYAISNITSLQEITVGIFNLDEISDKYGSARWIAPEAFLKNASTQLLEEVFKHVHSYFPSYVIGSVCFIN